MAWSSVACAIISAVLMGTIGVFSKITGLSAELVTMFRLLLGAAFMLGFLAVSGQLSLTRCWPGWAVLLNGFFLAGFILFYVQAMHFTSMANAIMLVYLAPLAAAVTAHFFLGERLNALAVGLILLALFGFAMMMEFRLDFTSGSREAIGLLLGVLALFSYAGFILMNRLIPGEVHVYTRTFYQLLTGGLVMLPFAWSSFGDIERWQIPWLVGTGVFPGFLAILCAVIALSRMPAATFGTLAYIEPVAVIIFGWTLFSESLSPLQLAGCALIVASGAARAVSSAKSRLSQPALQR